MHGIITVLCEESLRKVIDIEYWSRTYDTSWNHRKPQNIKLKEGKNKKI